MKFKKLISGLLCSSILLFNTTLVFGETPAKSYIGIDNAQAVLENIDFRDIASMPSDYWAKDAIHKMGALSIIQGYGEKTFRPSNSVSKAEVLALIYRAAGKEETAKKEAQRLEDARGDEVKKKNARDVWADGYLSLAQQDGLITQLEFDEATNPIPGLTSDTSFNPNSAAQRQQVAQWFAKAMKIDPIYNQNLVFNNFNDWRQIDQEKIPYIEALLKNKIMNGDNGYFRPKGILKRDEMAQILSNAGDYIYKANGLNKKEGYIESISFNTDRKTGQAALNKTINVRGSDGSLSSITVSNGTNIFDNQGKEIGGHGTLGQQNELVVNRNGVLGGSSILKKGDEVSFVFDNDNSIRYVEAKENPVEDKAIYGTIENVDQQNNTLSFADEKGNTTAYPVSQGVIVSVNGEGKTLNDVETGAKAYFTVNHNIITRIEVTNSKRLDTDPGSIVSKIGIKGIVQEVNPNLNYISLYGSDGKKGGQYVRTFNFTPSIQVTKNGTKAALSDIDIGDTVYIKFNKNYEAELINDKSNYISKYGEVLIVGDNSLTVKYEDGTIQELGFDKDMLVVKGNKVITKDDLVPGDKIKLTLNQTDNFVKIKAIGTEENQHFITNIYKGRVFDINEDNIVLFDTKVLNKDKWIPQSERGYAKFDFDDNARMYYENVPVSLTRAVSVMPNSTAYIAVYKEYGGNEKAVMVSAADGAEKTYNDEIIAQSKAGKNFDLANSFDNISYDDSTIVTKYGRLTAGNNIDASDPVYVVALRDPSNDQVRASVVQVVDKPSVTGIDIYRGRIKSIDEGKSFVTESFSVLRGTNWEFVNTPKTFGINSDTAILSPQGVVNNRDFMDYTAKSYKDKIVYIAAKGTLAEVISDAQYGVINLKGEVDSINTASGTNNAATITLNLKDSVVLNSTTGEWDSLGETIIDAGVDSIVIKNKNVADPSEIMVGDKIRVIKKDNTSKGQGFIILVEG